MPIVNAEVGMQNVPSDVPVSRDTLLQNQRAVSLVLPEVKNNFRTSKKLSGKAQQGHAVPVSEPLLRG